MWPAVCRPGTSESGPAESWKAVLRDPGHAAQARRTGGGSARRQLHHYRPPTVDPPGSDVEGRCHPLTVFHSFSLAGRRVGLHPQRLRRSLRPHALPPPPPCVASHLRFASLSQRPSSAPLLSPLQFVCPHSPGVVQA